jgi:hypothetical protein
MQGRAVIAGLLCVLAIGPAWAQSVTEMRPRARPVEDVEPVLRPQARPVAEAETVAGEAPEAPVVPVEDDAATVPARSDAPDLAALTLTLDAPVAADAEPDGPPLEGPPQMVMAETLMSEAPPPPVFTDAWVGVEPEVRPGTETAPDGTATFLRPEVRPEALPSVDTASVRVSLRPRARPAAPADPAPLVATAPDTAPVFGLEANDAPQFSPLAVAVALRPPARDFTVVERASAQPPPVARGSLCGVAGLEGEVLAAIRGSGGCGVEEPVRLSSVGGVRLSSAAIMDCGTATALLSWVQNSAQPRLNNTLARIETMGSYDCRPRNNQAGARLSEHGRGRAIDIGGFVLTTGERITVLNDWGSRAWGEALRAMHRDACGTFGTVLGPNANRQHANHFHFDTAEQRNGAYCR